MNSDNLFNYLVATDNLDDFLGYKIPQKIKEEIIEIADDYKKDLINDDELQNILMGLEMKYNINYEILVNFLKEQLNS